MLNFVEPWDYIGPWVLWLTSFFTLPDFINGTFEMTGGVMLLANVKAIFRDKKVRGMAVSPLAFFAAWGYWNTYYYPHLDQWASFVGGLIIVAVNTLYLALVIYYTLAEKKLDASRAL